MRTIFLTTALFHLGFSLLYGQAGQCTGNLGDNIFTQGDFGSGLANIVQTDPGIAPGFQYSVIVPIDDGEYVLTNNMALWPNIYPTWLQIGDHSTDPNGYMMVVNASFSPGIFYQETIEGLCENTLYEFSADVINVVRQSVPNHILPDVSFLIDSVEEFTTGPIPQNEAWGTYGFTFSTRPGQEQVTLTLRNNAPGGIGNDLALDNISFRPCGPSATITIDMQGRVCENALYPSLSAVIDTDTGYVQWQISEDAGTTWNDIPGATNRTYRSDQLNANTYLLRYLYASTLQNLQNGKCRIISATRILEVVPVYFTIVDTLCEGLGFVLGDTTYTTTGVFMDHLEARNGCDSIVTLYLDIVPDPAIEATLVTTPPLCSGAENGIIQVSFVQNGTPEYALSISSLPPVAIDQPLYVPAGVYTVYVSDRYGCSSIQNVTIDDPLPFIIDLKGDSAIYLGHAALVNTTGNYPIATLELFPVIGLECSNCVSTTASPPATTTYIASAVSSNGCIAVDSLRIVVDTHPRIYVPNVFSPNGDGVNDTWEIPFDPLNVKAVERIVIFDRWGTVLLEAASKEIIEPFMIWNGTSAGEEISPGVYTYLIELRLANAELARLSGSVTVVK